MNTVTITILLQGLVVICLIAFLIERARERERQREMERQAGEFLVGQIADAPEGATIILGAAKYRTRNPLRITRDNVTLQGAPKSTSQILVEGDNNAIEVADADKVCIRDMHIEILGPPPKFRTVTEQDYLDEGLTPMDDEPPCRLQMSTV